MMKYCTMCGKSYSDDTRFCSKDGYRLRDQMVFFTPQAEGMSPEVAAPRPQAQVSKPVTFVSRRDSGRAPFHANLSSRRPRSDNGYMGLALGIAVIVIGFLILSSIVFVGFAVHDGFDGFGSSFGSLGASFGELGSRFGEFGSRLGDMGSELGSRFGELGSTLGDMGSDLGARCGNLGVSVGPRLRIGALVGVLLFTSFLVVGVVLVVSSRRRRSYC